MAIQTGSGVSLSIGTTAAATTLAQFQADSYTTVGEVAEIGEFGDERAIVSFMALADGRVRKARGSANAGDAVITFAYDSTNVGQDGLRNAFNAVSQSADEFNFRVLFNDQISVNPTTWYFRARISQRRVQNITNDNIITVQVTLAINSALVELEAA
jgi:hypothetical protein